MVGLPSRPACLSVDAHRHRMVTRADELSEAGGVGGATNRTLAETAVEWLESAAVCQLCQRHAVGTSYLADWLCLARPVLLVRLDQWKTVSQELPRTAEERTDVADGRLLTWGILQLLEDAFVNCDDGSESSNVVAETLEEILLRVQEWDAILQQSPTWKRILRRRSAEGWSASIDVALLDPPPWWLSEPD